jgi:LEA14-like dessication related protein
MLQNGHDWAADHITTSKDDIQEVAEWIRNEIEEQSETQEEPVQTVVDVEGDDDNVEIEDEEVEDEEE